MGARRAEEPTWVLMHALAYLAATHRMDATAVRRTLDDMRMLLQCKKGAADILGNSPLPEKDEELPEWVHRAHNASLGPVHVEMHHGLGARIAAMDAATRRAFVMVATVRAADNMRRCVGTRAQHAAWARFKLLAKSMPVALRATDTAFGTTLGDVVGRLQQLANSKGTATETAAGALRELAERSMSDETRREMQGLVYSVLMSPELSDREVNEVTYAFTCVEIDLFGELSPRHTKPTMDKLVMLERLQRLLQRGRHGYTEAFVRHENRDIAGVEWEKLRRTYEANVALRAHEEDDSVTYTEALVSFLRTANECGCAELGMFGGPKEHVYALLSRKLVTDEVYAEAAGWAWNGEYEPLYRHVFDFMQRVKQADKRVGLRACCLPLRMLSAAYTDTASLFRDAVDLAKVEKCRCHEALLTMLSSEIVAKHASTNVCARALLSMIDAKPDGSWMLMPTWSMDAMLACLLWNVRTRRAEVRERCARLLPQAIEEMDVRQLYKLFLAYGFGETLERGFLLAVLEHAAARAATAEASVRTIAALAVARPNLFVVYDESGKRVQLRSARVSRERWDAYVALLKKPSMSLEDEVEMLTTHREANDAIAELGIGAYRGVRLERTLCKLREDGKKRDELVTRIYKTYGREMGLIADDAPYLVHLAEIAYKDEKGFRDGVDLSDVNNKSVLAYIEEEARKRGGYEPLRKLVERLGDDAGDRAYRALLYTYRRTKIGEADTEERRCRALKWTPGACEALQARGGKSPCCGE
jgi:hypothetical protein